MRELHETVVNGLRDEQDGEEQDGQAEQPALAPEAGPGDEQQGQHGGLAEEGRWKGSQHFARSGIRQQKAEHNQQRGQRNTHEVPRADGIRRDRDDGEAHQAGPDASLEHGHDPLDVVNIEFVLPVDLPQGIGRSEVEHPLPPTDFLAGGEQEEQRAENIGPPSALPGGSGGEQQRRGQEQEERGAVLDPGILLRQESELQRLQHEQQPQQRKIETKENGAKDGNAGEERDAGLIRCGRGLRRVRGGGGGG